MPDDAMLSEYTDKDQRYAVCVSLWDEKEEKSMDDNPVEDILGELELRTFPKAELRLKESDKEGTIGTLEGLPGISYNSWSEDLGGFVERILPGACNRSLLENDIVSCRDHEDHLILGRVSSGFLRLDNRDDGLYYEVDLPETTYARDLLVSVGRKDVKGNSFRFCTIDDRWTMTGGKEYRDIVEMELYELGPVTMPAYPQTGLGLRSLFHSLGLDHRHLYRSLLRARTGQMEQRDTDMIASAVEALKRYLPDGGQGASPAPDKGPQGRIPILRRSLEALEKHIGF
ncbi:MAG: HK97 family phage prohead protease [Actinomycetota bacterium]|nr:HK97 family phage prohead protease [Actinomycetota bacterium]